MIRTITKAIRVRTHIVSRFWDAARARHAAFGAVPVVILCLAGGLGAISLPSPAQGQSGQTAEATARLGVRAIARAKEDLALAFSIPGRVEKIIAPPGTVVRKGQALLTLNAKEAQAEVELLRIRANSKLEEDASKAEWDLAKLEEERWDEVHERGASTDMQLRKARLETQRAKLAYELFVQRRSEAVLQLQQAEARLEAFTLVAPTDGVVDEVVIEQGEVTEPGKPVVRLVNTSVMRIDVSVTTEMTLGLKVGGEATMTALLTSPPIEAKGKITHIASVADASSATRLVRVEVPRPDGLPAGIECYIRFE